MEGVITNPDGTVAAEATSTMMMEKLTKMERE